MTGTATYEGISAGDVLYAPTVMGIAALQNALFRTESDVEAVVDFATRSINFMTTGTELSNHLSDPIGLSDTIRNFTDRLDLDMTGTLTYDQGSNHFTGTVTTVGGFTGTANGLFYGPAAEEIGGTFVIQGGNVASYIGGFGAAQQPAAR